MLKKPTYSMERVLTFKQRAEIITKHFDKKISQEALSKEYGVSRQTISRHCRLHGKSPLDKDYVMDDAAIVRMYTEEKKSVLQIATILGTTPRPITRRLKLARIKRKVRQRYVWEKEIPHYFLKLKIWIAKVIELDGMKCRMCGAENSRANRLEGHHIVPMRDITDPNMVFDVNNGICLCRKCHMSIHYHEKKHEIFFRNLIQTRSSE